MLNTQNLPDREQDHKEVPVLKSSDNSVTSERSSKLHQSAKVTTKKQDEKNCEEKCKSRNESQNDPVPQCATSKEQGACSPRKQQTHNPQENMNIQCFSEDVDKNLYDFIPGNYMHVRTASEPDNL